MEQETKQPFDLNGRTQDLALRVINTFQYLTERSKRKEQILSKQFLLAGTSIGDKVRQKDFIAALGHAQSTLYWLQLLVNGGYLNNEQSEEMLLDCIRVKQYLYAIVHPEARNVASGQVISD